MVPVIRPIARRFASLLLVVALVGCPRNRGVEEDLRAALTAADLAWRDRDEGGLPAVATALDAAEAVVPGHPEVGWRRVRLGIATGLTATDPVEALRAYSSARAAGITCIAGPGGATTTLTVVVRRFEDAVAPCVAWTALAWVRWLEVFGPSAAALDFARLDYLIAASAGGPTLTGPHLQVADWAEGILAAVRTDAPDLDLAEARLRAVAENDADDAVVLLDWLRLVVEPRGDAAAAAELAGALREADLDTPEERITVGAWRTRTVGAP